MAAAAPAETASPAALCLAPKAPVAPWALKAVLVRPGQLAPLGPKASRAYKGPKDLKVSPASLALKACRDCKAHPALPDPKDLRASLGLPGLQAQRVSLAVLPLWKWAMSPQEPPALTPK